MQRPTRISSTSTSRSPVKSSPRGGWPRLRTGRVRASRSSRMPCQQESAVPPIERFGGAFTAEQRLPFPVTRGGLAAAPPRERVRPAPELGQGAPRRTSREPAARVLTSWAGHTSRKGPEASASVEQATLGHVVRRQDLEEELRGCRGHVDDLPRSGVGEHLKEDFVMDPSQLEDAHTGSKGAATELIPAGQGRLRTSRQRSQERCSVVARHRLEVTHRSAPASDPRGC